MENNGEFSGTERRLRRAAPRVRMEEEMSSRLVARMRARAAAGEKRAAFGFSRRQWACAAAVALLCGIVACLLPEQAPPSPPLAVAPPPRQKPPCFSGRAKAESLVGLLPAYGVHHGVRYGVAGADEYEIVIEDVTL